MAYFVKRQNIQSSGLILPSGPTVERPTEPEPAAMRYNTDTESVEYFNGTVYVDIAKAGDASVTVDHLATDGIVDTFTMSMEETDSTNIVVFINGIYQIPGLSKAYTVSGFDITFTAVPDDDLSITVMHGVYGTFVPNSNVYDVPNL